MPGREDQITALTKGAEEGLVNINDLKRCAARVLALIRKNTIYHYGE